MNTSTIRRPQLTHFACVLASLILMASTSVWAATAERTTAPWRNDDTTYVFAGKCASEESYRLVSYQKNVSGFTQSFYDYEGPNGKGTIRAETDPKVMAARVCRKMAEIINANYWE